MKFTGYVTLLITRRQVAEPQNNNKRNLYTM